MTKKRTTKKAGAAEVRTDISNAPAVQVAREQQPETDENAIHVLSTGVRVRLLPVSVSLIEEVRTRVKDPVVPILYDEEKDREIPNPNDPTYLRLLESAEEKRNRATVDAIIMFGVELVDPMPEDTSWIRKLALLGVDFDQDDEYAVEFAYKRYIAINTVDIPKVCTMSSPITGEEVEKAMSTFPGQDEG